MQSVDEDLLSEAAAQAPAAAWQNAAAVAAAAAATTSAHPGGGASSSREGSSSPRSQGAATAQHVRTLLHLGGKALRATVIAVELLRRQQQSLCSDDHSSRPSSPGCVTGTAAMRFCAAAGDAGGGVADAEGSAVLGRFRPGAEVFSCRRRSLLIHLQVLLQEQVMCLGPWFEPWRFRPERTPLRLLTLQAAQVR